MLTLEGLAKVVTAAAYPYPVTLKLEKGPMNVLLGPTLAGKTSLLRLMAGLDKPTAGRVWSTARDVTGLACATAASPWSTSSSSTTRPSRSTRTSPRRCGSPACRGPRSRRGCSEAARLLRLTPIWSASRSSSPAASSSARAIARALVKGAGLVLLDEPLANLDYKLREELRDELPQIFAESARSSSMPRPSRPRRCCSAAIPRRCSEGRVTQFGPTPRGLPPPADLATARVFSDPPMNFIGAPRGRALLLAGGAALPAPAPRRPAGRRLPDRHSAPHHFARADGPDAVALPAAVRCRGHRLGELRASRARRPPLGRAAPGVSDRSRAGGDGLPRPAALPVFGEDGRLAAAPP